MTQETTEENKDTYKMVAVKVQKDHREEKYVEFSIDTSFYEDVITVLNKFESISKQRHIKEQEEAEELITCPYGETNCDEDDYESMCDGCKTDRAEAHNDAMMDTYD